MSVQRPETVAELIGSSSAMKKDAGEARNDFRRKAMLAKYPQITKLYGFDARTKYWVLLSVGLQIFTAFLAAKFDWAWSTIAVLAWIWGGTINHSLMLAAHELSHDLLFPVKWQNEYFGLVCNAALTVPLSAGFKKYHLVHHRYQGLDGVDPDLPSAFEGQFFRHVLPKAFFIFFQQFIYVLRPLMLYPSKTLVMEIIAAVSVVTTDFLLLHFFGFKSLAYLFLSTFLGSGFHPLAAHFVAEHYEWISGFETFSYYGPLNSLVYNVGYHNEHHDFPRIPGSRLPQLHKIAPEFYTRDQIGIIPSWPGVIWRFMADPSITPFSRVKRKEIRYSLPVDS